MWRIHGIIRDCLGETPRRKLFGVAFTLLLVGRAWGEEFVAGTISGRVTDIDGNPLVGATILFNRATGARMDLKTPPTATSNEVGEYRLALRFERGKTLHVREIFVDRPGYVRAAPDIDLAITEGETVPRDFVLESGLKFAGELRLSPLPHETGTRADPRRTRRLIKITGPGLGDRPSNAHYYFTEPGGAFSLYLPRGEYTVEVGPSTGYGSEPFRWSNLRAGVENLILEPTPFGWTPEELGKLFDELWQTMDRQYSYFFLKPDVDWSRLRDEYRPQALAVTNATELTAVLQKMLAPLRDSHVWIETSEGRVSPYRSSYAYNGNLEVILDQLEAVTTCGEYAIVGRTKKDGYGYFLMLRQSAANPALVKSAGDAIRAMADAPGFIVDLRRANGGNEPLAAEIAKLFCAEETIYARSKRRSGPGHEDFGKVQDRVLPASENPYTRPVVCLIGPGAVSSGEGFVKMMACLPWVTTVGQRTRGASGNPAPWHFGRTGLSVYFSRWVDLMPDGQTFEGVGIPPEIEVRLPPEAYRSADPTLVRGLEILNDTIRDRVR